METKKLIKIEADNKRYKMVIDGKQVSITRAEARKLRMKKANEV